jgi:hypothetical protein
MPTEHLPASEATRRLQVPTEHLPASEAARRPKVPTKALLRHIHHRAVRTVMVDGIAHVPVDAVEECHTTAS